MSLNRLTTLLFALTLFVGVAFGVTLNVPNDFEIIQGAVDAAENGDTVLVAPGVYEQTFRIQERPLVIGSRFLLDGDTTWLDQTVIDGQANGSSVVSIRDVREPGVELVGLTIRNGSTDYGGGIYARASFLTLRCLNLTENVATRGGAGLYATLCSTLTLEAVTLVANHTWNLAGGGATVTRNSTATLYGCTFLDNIGGQGGGLAILDTSRVTILRCQFLGNVSDAGGGISVVRQSECEIDSTDLIGNNGGGAGGAIYGYAASSIVMRNSRVSNNTAESGGGFCIYAIPEFSIDNTIISNNEDMGGFPYGGGLYLNYMDNPTITRSLICGNRTNGHGGAIHFSDGGRLTIDHTTIVDNIAGDDGGGAISIHDMSSINAINSIFWGNGEGSVLVDFATFSISYCDFEHGPDGAVRLREDIGTIVNYGDGILNENPLFVDVDDYHLTADSPCIDAVGPWEFDPDGTHADMGCFFFHQRDIDVEVQELIFEPVEEGGVDSLSFVIHNTGGNALTINSFNWEQNEPRFFTREEEAFEIEANGEYVVWVYFEPNEPLEYRSSFIIESDDPDEGEISVEVMGNSFSGVDDEVAMPLEFEITGVYPNPFNSTTTISYGLPYPGKVSLLLYNPFGQQVSTLFEGNRQAGIYSANLTGRDLASGLYFVRLEGSGQVFTRKVLLVR